MGVLVFGGLEEIRTPDPHNANVVRSQLRYKPKDYLNIIRRWFWNVKDKKKWEPSGSHWGFYIVNWMTQKAA